MMDRLSRFLDEIDPDVPLDELPERYEEWCDEE